MNDLFWDQFLPLDEYLLGASYVADTALGTGDTAVDKTKTCPCGGWVAGNMVVLFSSKH